MSDQYGRVLENKEIEVLCQEVHSVSYKGMVFPLAHRGSPALRWFAIGQQQDWVHQLLPRRDSLLRGLCAEEHGQLLIRLRTEVRSDSPPGSVGPAFSIGAQPVKCPWARIVWYYDFRTNTHLTLKLASSRYQLLGKP